MTNRNARTFIDEDYQGCRSNYILAARARSHSSQHLIQQPACERRLLGSLPHRIKPYKVRTDIMWTWGQKLLKITVRNLLGLQCLIRSVI